MRLKKVKRRDKISEVISLLNSMNEAIKKGGDSLSLEIRKISREIDRRIPYRDEHSGRVADLCLKTAETLRLSSLEKKNLEIAALLHDFGKIGVEENLLTLRRKLTPDERKEIEEHVLRGYYILDGFPDIAKVLRGLKEHHEHWNGKGYPEGKRGDEICIEARIIAVVDAYDAMVTKRPYRKPLTKKEACLRLMESSGRHFDPKVVEAFVKTI